MGELFTVLAPNVLSGVLLKKTELKFINDLLLCFRLIKTMHSLRKFEPPVLIALHSFHLSKKKPGSESFFGSQILQKSHFSETILRQASVAPISPDATQFAADTTIRALSSSSATSSSCPMVKCVVDCFFLQEHCCFAGTSTLLSLSKISQLKGAERDLACWQMLLTSGELSF